jgi:hypothetical protein
MEGSMRMGTKILDYNRREVGKVGHKKSAFYVYSIPSSRFVTEMRPKDWPVLNRRNNLGWVSVTNRDQISST